MMLVCVDISVLCVPLEGIGRYTERIVARLPFLAHDLLISTFSYGRHRVRVPVSPEGQGLHVHVPVPGKALLLAWERLHWPSVEGLMGPMDLFHATNYTVPTLRKAKLVLNVYDLFFLSKASRACTFEERRFRKSVIHDAHRADRVIVLSRHVADQLVRDHGVEAGKIHIIPGAPDPEFKRPSDEEIESCRRKWGLDQPYVLHVGFQTERKDLPTLVQAWARSSMKESLLALVGREGPATPHLKSMLKSLGGADRVRFLCYVPKEDLPGLYAGSSCFVLCSLEEGFGLPVLEAMACGAPVIVSAAGTLPEIAQKAGLVVPVGDPGALAEAIAKILKDPSLREDLGQAGCQRASLFSWHESARLTSQVYRSVLG